MDPVSIAAACSSIAFTIVRNGRALAAIFDKYHTAQRSVFMIQTECTVLAAALSQLESSITGQNAWRLSKCPPSVTDALDLSLTGCTLTLSVLEKEITAMTDGITDSTPKMGKSDRAKYVWKEESMNELLQQLRGQSTALTLLLKALDSTSIDQILGILQSGQPTFQRVRKGAASIRSAYPKENYAESIIEIPFDDSKTIYSLELRDKDLTSDYGETSTLAEKSVSRGESLPQGWERAYSTQYNQWYYIDTATRKSQWEHPKCSPLSSPQPDPQRKPINPGPRTNTPSKDQMPSVSQLSLQYHPREEVQEEVDLAPWALNSRQKLEAFLDGLRQEHSVPALALGIVFADRPPEIFVRGWRRSDTRTPVTRSDKFTLSINDTMAFSVLAMLIDRGLLKWEDRLVDFLPTISQRAHPFHKDTTFTMVASHRSGISLDLYAVDNGDLRKYLERRDITAKQGRFATALFYLMRPPDHNPGEKFEWNTANMMLVALVLEELTNQPIEALYKSLLFDPLEMYSAGFGWPDMTRNFAANPTQPWPHNGISKQPMEILPNREINMPALHCMRGVHCSPADYATYIQFQLRGAMGLNTASLLSKEMMDFAQQRISPENDSFSCAGWCLTERDWAKGLTLASVGAAHGASNNAWLAPLNNVGLFAIANMDCDSARKVNDEAVSAGIRYCLATEKIRQ